MIGKMTDKVPQSLPHPVNRLQNISGKSRKSKPKRKCTLPACLQGRYGLTVSANQSAINKGIIR
ncbi:hypothetical protein [Bacteroides acidifaciens]|uniref:hypothetical protein n=1 Tax=Bacteroides acidifaciens TaxID=85831 RepID=UPI0025B62152|nr:hypothetical protein [Bacteroides acidifaciens]